jgi:hypothetical protein
MEDGVIVAERVPGAKDIDEAVARGFDRQRQRQTNRENGRGTAKTAGGGGVGQRAEVSVGSRGRLLERLGPRFLRNEPCRGAGAARRMDRCAPRRLRG